MKKCDLRDGMFGVLRTAEGQYKFLVAGDKLIYEDGEYDRIDEMNDNLDFGDIDGEPYHIESLHEARNFADIGAYNEIWHRPEPKKVESKSVEDIGKATITITLEQYAEALERASKKFAEIAAEDKVDPVLFMIMSTQNITFGALIADELFGKHINEDNKEDK